MNEALAESIFHTGHTICGRRLRPLSLWHVWLLDFVGSPFVGASESGTPADLALAIEICSRPPSCPEKFPRFQIRPSRRLIRRIAQSGARNVAAEFRAYMADHVAMPRVWETGDGRPIRSHICLYSVAVLMRHGRRTEPQAWATGFGYARHLALALAEADGNEIPLLSAAEEAALIEAGHSV